MLLFQFLEMDLITMMWSLSVSMGFRDATNHAYHVMKKYTYCVSRVLVILVQEKCHIDLLHDVLPGESDLIVDGGTFVRMKIFIC